MPTICKKHKDKTIRSDCTRW